MEANPSTPRLRSSRLVVPVLFLVSSLARAQDANAPAGVADLEHGRFVSTFGGADADFATAVCEGPGRDAYVAGWTQSFGAGDADFWVARIGPRGKARWEQAIGGVGRDLAAGLAATADGGCIVVGSTTSFGAGAMDGWITKLSADGTVEWQRAVGGALDDELRAVACSPDGYYVGGRVTSTQTGSDAWILELDVDGNVLWQRTFEGTNDDRLNSLDATPNGVVFVAGTNSELGEVPGVVFTRPFLVELDGTGNVLWQKAYNYSGGDVWTSIVALEQGGFAVIGEVLAFAFLRGDLWAAQLDAVGNVIWDRRYGDNFGVNWVDSGVGVQAARGGGFAALGSTGTAGAGSEDLWLLGLNSVGELRWGATYGGPLFDNASGLARAPGGGFTVVGTAQPGSLSPPDVLVLRVTPAGRSVGACRLQGAVDPNQWTDALQVDDVDLALSSANFGSVATNALVLPLDTGVLTCPPIGKPFGSLDER